MCFSAEASFAASAALGACGIVALKKAESPSQKLFGGIPLAFGIQQFTEGILWVSLSNTHYAEWSILATHIFLFFAWVLWPLYVPLSVRLLEQQPNRKIWLNILIFMGLIVSAILAYALFAHDVEAQISGHHISYHLNYELQYPLFIGVAYFAPIVGSLFVSGRSKMWIVGSLVLGSFIISMLFYKSYLISVWCFFAAITSVSILWMLFRLNKHKPSTTK